ncbi:MAG: GspH/FimT family pseudopilin [Pseudomonadales bacterium]|nr:GspH/FimT family pseudopilin [Pseudomonadales bacterium]
MKAVKPHKSTFRHFSNKCKGLTLIELMVGLVIIGIGFGVALPGFQGMVKRNAIATQVNQMLLAINLARSEAGRLGFIVSVQAAAPTSGDEFGAGWCVIPQPDPAVLVPCSDTTVIQQFSELTNDATLNLIDDGGNTTIQFSPLGGLRGDRSRSLDFCMPGQLGRRIFISPVGRAKSHSETDPITARQPTC